MPDLADTLKRITVITKTAGSIFGGTFGDVAKAVASGIGLVADFAAAGFDPVEHIERLRKTEPMLRSVELGWEKRIMSEFDPDDL